MQLSEKTYSPTEYISQEETADYKSEYIDGQIMPLAGGTINHNQIALNFSTEINFAFKKLDYRVYMGDVRLWIPARLIFTYPDVMVIAGEPEYFNNRTDTITNPVLIIEVLSDSTEAYDRERKFKAYRTLPSFTEYLLVDKTKVSVEQFSKTGNKSWLLREYDTEDTAITLTSVELQIALADIYSKVKFTLETTSE